MKAQTIALATLLLLAAPAVAGDKNELELNEFTRVVDREVGGDALQCSIRVYTPPKPMKGGMKKLLGPMGGMMGGKNKPLPPRPEIVLISMIHLGEKSFYAAARKELATCDLVLYEEQGDAALGAASGAMIAAATGLSFQGVEIPMNKKTWRSADLTQDQLFAMLGVHPDVMKRMTQMSKQMGGMKINPEMLKNNPMLKSMIPTREKIMAQMRSGAKAEAQAGGKEMADMILYQRNAIVMGEMTKASHESHKRVAVLYGAAHMPGVEAYLRGPMRYKLKSVEWIDAVYADPKAAAKAKAEGSEETPDPVQPKNAPKDDPKKKNKDWF